MYCVVSGLHSLGQVTEVSLGSNSLRSLGPQRWNGLPNEIKSAENLNSFKHMIKKWDGPNCKCNACQHVKDS